MHQNFENSDEIIFQLKMISEQLADRALSVLKEAHSAGETKRPEAERTLTQARRAVEKAISLLTRD
jgi:N-acetylmuramic acid 6-phosphate (MurNAc-6-P) etherase